MTLYNFNYFRRPKSFKDHVIKVSTLKTLILSVAYMDNKNKRLSIYIYLLNKVIQLKLSY